MSVAYDLSGNDVTVNTITYGAGGALIPAFEYVQWPERVESTSLLHRRQRLQPV